MKTISKLEEDYKKLLNQTNDLSREIIQHLYVVFDEKLNTYKDWDSFLEDINNYAQEGTFGKLMYINYAKNYFNGLNIK